MGIRKRGSKWHYEFRDGQNKRVSGVCLGCTTEKAALAYDKRIQAEYAEIKAHKSVESLVKDYAKELKGGADIPLSEVWVLFLTTKRAAGMSIDNMRNTQGRWDDFTAFAESIGILNMADCIPLPGATGIADDYKTLLETSGRFIKEKTVDRKGGAYGHKLTCTKPSPKTILVTMQSLGVVWESVAMLRGVESNPFKGMKIEKSFEERDMFSDVELHQLWECDDPFLAPLFKVAMTTALRLNDICLLKVSNVNLTTGMLRKVQGKTKRLVEIPLPSLLVAYISEFTPDSDGFIFHDQAEMYRFNRCGVSHKITDFLESIGIKTTKKVQGRSNAVVVKGFHSIRHSVLTLLARGGTQIQVLRSIAGHSAIATTGRYLDHVERSEKAKAINSLPMFSNGEAETLRRSIQSAMDRTSDLDRLRQALAVLEK